MSGFDFQETFLLEIPNVDEQLSEFAEHDFQESHGLVIEIAAIHAGLTSNYNAYEAEALESSLASWTQPYPKPVILNHDVMTEPVGRIIGARMDKEADGTPYVRLQAAITDPLAVAKVSDKRYLTGSVGGKANEAVCSICNVDWAAPKESTRGGLPCRHMRGKVYGGKLAYLSMKKVSFKEYSFVNVPADERSGVVPTAVQTDESGWVKAARFLVVDMDHEEIVEYTESASHELLASMKKKEAAPFYHGMKGAYLAVLAIEESEGADKKLRIKSDKGSTNLTDDNDLHEETGMADNALETQVEDDILAVSEGLSDDLDKISDVSEDGDEGETDEPKPEEDPDADKPADEKPVTSDEKPAEDAPAEDKPADEEAPAGEDGTSGTTTATELPEDDAKKEEEGERPEGQEKPKDSDVDPETSAGAPPSREDAAPKDDSDEQTDDAELSEESGEVTEPHADELKSELEALKAENAKLRKVLHKSLAERVVDAKIGAGVIDFENRKEAIEEHVTRTASSLADSLRDYAGQIVKVGIFGAPKLQMDEQSEVVEGEEQVITIGEDEESSKPVKDPMKSVEDTLVDALSGRITLQF